MVLSNDSSINQFINNLCSGIDTCDPTLSTADVISNLKTAEGKISSLAYNMRHIDSIRS